ncbi:hypothetical protein [Geobacillus stearothermophilus]
MKVEELATKVNKLEMMINSLRDNMQIYQDNINNNITWFYASLGIVLAVILPSLYFLVKTSVSKGIENGIEKTYKKFEDKIRESQQFKQAFGSASVSVKHNNLIQVHGFPGLNKENFVSLTIVNKHGRVCDYHSLDIVNEGFKANVVDYNPDRDGMGLYWTVIWRNDSYFDNN